ncbi:hypothetical protein PSENEW3_00000419 [Picochlorum sp. SENEW3]|nr:hypothetical protein PSENEW3_00000419 [Picochlorum sp. SENEW3]
MSEEVFLSPGLETAVRLRSPDGTDVHELCTVYEGWTSDMILKELEETIKKLELQKRSESDDISHITIIFTAEDCLETQGTSGFHGSTAISTRQSDSPQDADFKKWILGMLYQYWPRIHKDQEEYGEVYGAFALERPRGRKGIVDKYFWEPGRVRVLYEIQKEGRRRKITDLTKFFKYVTTYTNNTTSNLRLGKLRSQVVAALRGSADVYWDNFGRYIRDNNGAYAGLVPPGDDWKEVMQWLSRPSPDASNVCSMGLTSNIIQASAARGTVSNRNDYTPGIESSDDEDLREQPSRMCQVDDDHANAILDSQLHANASAFDVPKQASLLRKITSLQDDVKSLREMAAKEKDDSGLQQVIKKKNEEIRSLKDEIKKLKQPRNRKRRPAGCSNVEAWQQDGRRYISSAKDRAERCRRKERSENTPVNTDITLV